MDGGVWLLKDSLDGNRWTCGVVQIVADRIDFYLSMDEFMRRLIYDWHNEE